MDKSIHIGNAILIAASMIRAHANLPQYGRIDSGAKRQSEDNGLRQVRVFS